jgi:hypothetical protein
MADTKQTAPIKPQTRTGAVHPEAYRDDLNPDAMAGQNIGVPGKHPEKGTRTLRDIKELHAEFRDWSDNDLKQIPVLPEGSRLEQGATYIDLAGAEPREFTATGGMHTGHDHRYVPKSEVPYELWNRLLGIQNVARTGVSE